MQALPNPSVSIVLSLLYSVYLSFFGINQPLILLPSLLAFLMCKNKTKVIKALFGLNLFLIILFASYIYSQKQTQGLMILIKSNLIICFILSLFIDSSSHKIALAMANLKINNKLVVILFLTIKFIEQFKNDISNFHARLKARCFKPKTNMLTYKTYASFVALLIFSGIKRVSSTKECMIVRNFNPSMLSSKIDFNMADKVWIASMALLFVCCQGGYLDFKY